MIINWWSKREKRERTLLSIMFGFIFVLACYELVDNRSTTQAPANKSSWEQKRKDLLLSYQLEDQILLLQQKGAHIQQRANKTLIQKSLKKTSMQQFLSSVTFSKKQVVLKFDSAPFDQLAGWLTDLTARSTAHITHWSATRLANKGMVSAVVELAY